MVITGVQSVSLPLSLASATWLFPQSRRDDKGEGEKEETEQERGERERERELGEIIFIRFHLGLSVEMPSFRFPIVTATIMSLSRAERWSSLVCWVEEQEVGTERIWCDVFTQSRWKNTTNTLRHHS